MNERVEVRAGLADDNRTVTLEMLVGGQVVGSVVLGPHEMDYHIGAMQRLREGMADKREK
jgi:hypothetical protein